MTIFNHYLLYRDAEFFLLNIVIPEYFFGPLFLLHIYNKTGKKAEKKYYINFILSFIFILIPDIFDSFENDFLIPLLEDLHFLIYLLLSLKVLKSAGKKEKIKSGFDYSVITALIIFRIYTFSEMFIKLFGSRYILFCRYAYSCIRRHIFYLVYHFLSLMKNNRKKNQTHDPARKYVKTD